MRLATFNVHHGTVGKHGRVDPRRLGEVCAGFEADVLALQEVDRGTYRTGRADLVAAVAEATGMDGEFGRARWFPGGEYGNALLVRGTIDDWSVVPLPKAPSWQVWQERRTALVADVSVGGVALSVTATHLAVPGPVNTVQLAGLLRWHAVRPGPTVLLGDLNARPSIVGPIVRGAGLELVAHGPTNPAPDPVRAIDHVVLGPGFVVRSAEVVVTPMSDHAALLVDVDVEPRASAAAHR